MILQIFSSLWEFYVFQVLFDAMGCLRKFANVGEICKEFYETRKKKYIERKKFQEGMLRAQSERLSNQVLHFLSLCLSIIQVLLQPNRPFVWLLCLTTVFTGWLCKVNCYFFAPPEFSIQFFHHGFLQARFILAKIKGEIQIENKRKAVIVEQLIKKGFDPDPVKKWKELQKKKELEMTGETQIDDEDIEEEEEVSCKEFIFWEQKILMQIFVVALL